MNLTSEPSIMKRDQSIDFLRAVAILLVAGVHVSQFFPPLIRASATFLSKNGAFGVQLFFIVSAYTLLLTAGKTICIRSVAAFYIRRVFRIVPLFWLAGAFYLAKNGLGAWYWAPAGISNRDIALSFSFLNWLTPTSFNSVVPGQWSIGIEMSFYALFPGLAYLWLRGRRLSIYTAFVVIHILAHGVLPLLARYCDLQATGTPQYLIDAFFEFWLPKQLLAFGFGFLLFQLIEERSSDPLPLTLLGLTCLLSAWGTTLLCLFLFSYLILAIRIDNPFATLLGRCSYSVYLIHFAIISLLKFISNKSGVHLPFEVAFILVILISLLIAEFITRPLIEDRFIAIGKQLARNLRAKT